MARCGRRGQGAMHLARMPCAGRLDRRYKWQVAPRGGTRTSEHGATLTDLNQYGRLEAAVLVLPRSCSRPGPAETQAAPDLVRRLRSEGNNRVHPQTLVA